MELLVTLKLGERWTYEPPGSRIAWVALATGALIAARVVEGGGS